MAEQNNSICAICGRPYYLCLACKSNKLTPWKIHTDTSEHYKIYQILHGVTSGVYNLSEAKSKLENVDLSGLDDFVPRIKERIEGIMNNNTDETVSDKNQSENSEPIKVLPVKKGTRKRKTKVETEEV